MAAVRPAGPEPMISTFRTSLTSSPPCGPPPRGSRLYDEPAPRRDASPESQNGPGDRSPGPSVGHGRLLLRHVGRLLPLRALHDVELHRLAFGQRAEARAPGGGGGGGEGLPPPAPP